MAGFILKMYIKLRHLDFETCFSRKSAFRWLVVITVGLMLRSDKLGVTSIIRDLALHPGCYDSMLHFFRASSWLLEEIRGHTLLLHRPAVGPEAVPGAAVRAGGDGWRPGHPGKHQPGAGAAVHHPALQLPVPD